MKNTILLSCVFLLFFLFTFSACQYQPERFEQPEKDDYTLFELGRYAEMGLDEDTEWSILLAYYHKLKNVTINDVWIEKYIGTYCPPYIVQKLYNDGDDWDSIYHGDKNQTVLAVKMGAQGVKQQEASIRHWYGRASVRGGNSIFLWHEGQLYDLADHYDYNSGGLLFVWDFLGIANLQNGLDAETQLRIEEDWGKSMPIPWLPGYYYQIGIQYLGTYNGYIVLKTCHGTNTAGTLLTIDGISFYYSSSGDRIFAWKEGEIYTMQRLLELGLATKEEERGETYTLSPSLYEQGLITRKDLLKMAYNLNGATEQYNKEMDNEFWKLAYDKNYKYPDGFYYEKDLIGSVYYVNTISIKPLREQGQIWVELHTMNKEEARHWSDLTDEYSSETRYVFQEKETEKYFEFARANNDIVLTRVHKSDYFIPIRDKLSEDSVIGIFNGDLTISNVKELTEYLWDYPYRLINGAKVSESTIHEQKDRFEHYIQSIQVVGGDWRVNDMIYIYDNTFILDKNTRILSLAEQKLTRQITGIKR